MTIILILAFTGIITSSMIFSPAEKPQYSPDERIVVPGDRR